MSDGPSSTPLRRALRKGSALVASVCDGMSAVSKPHHSCFDNAVRSTFGDSLNLDDAMKVGHEQENRWDYLLGHAPTNEIVAVEPHSAKEDEISAVIRKRTCAREHLKAHLNAGARVSRWLWVASGKVHFADTEKARRRLDQNGIEFVGRAILEKHLPVTVPTTRSQPSVESRRTRTTRKNSRRR